VLIILYTNMQTIFQWILLRYIEHKGGETIKKQETTTKILISLLFICFAVILCTSTVSAANEVYVNTTGNDSGTGTANDPYLTIQTGVNNLDPDGIIHIANGQYSGVNNTNITLNKNMAIIGESQEGTIIDGTGPNWIFNIIGGVNVTLQNLTLTNATATTFGAINNTGNLTVENCTFTYNNETSSDYMSYGGGAIRNSADFGTIIVNLANCTFEYNHAGRGAAVLNYCEVPGNYVISTVTNCIFNNNTADVHATFYNVAWSGDIICEVANCTFTNNTVGIGGGGIMNFASSYNTYQSSITTTITDSTFISNHASQGGAIYSWANVNVKFINCNVTNCNFINNTAISGGAIAALQTSGNLNLTAHFNRIVGNNATTGTAIYNIGGTVNATCNWWGSNTDPSTINNLIVGTVESNPWLYMTINATPSTINNLETSLITASFNNLCNGTTVTPYIPGVGEYIPDNSPVIFATTLGSIPGTIKNTAGGISTATFTASQTSGTAYISGLIDNYQTPYDPNNPNTTPYTTVTINPIAYLNITKTANVTSANIGDVVRFTINITNNGPDNVTTIVLEDIFSLDGFEGVPIMITPAADSLSYLGTAGVLKWANILDSFGGILLPGNSVSILLDLRVNETAAGTTLYNTANITSIVYPYFNESTVSVDVNQANVELNKTVNNTRPNVGETVLFTIVATNNGPNTANNLVVTDTLPAGLDFISCTDGGVWNPVTRTVTWPAAIVANGGNVTYYITALVNSTSLAGTNVTNVVNETHTEYPGNSTTNCTIYVPKSDLYIQITSDKNNPRVGETFTLTYKLGNNGPDDATNVTITIPIPEGFHISSITGDGTWNIVGNNIIWTFNNVTVGDPYLYITGWTTAAGNYIFTASINSNTFNINSRGINSLSINAQPQVNAATTTKTIGMQKTGIPIAGIVLAILMVLGGFIGTRKKQ
jgi:uncharacterized repeat protein (TIGR01451 family)